MIAFGAKREILGRQVERNISKEIVRMVCLRPAATLSAACLRVHSSGRGRAGGKGGFCGGRAIRCRLGSSERNQNIVHSA